jgi:hypothetical protein
MLGVHGKSKNVICMFSVVQGDNWGVSLEERCKVTLFNNVVYGNNAAALYVDGSDVECEARCNAFLKGASQCTVMDVSGTIQGFFADNVVQGWEECTMAHTNFPDDDSAHKPLDHDVDITGTRNCADEDAAFVMQESLDMIMEIQKPITKRVVVINPCASMCVGIPSGLTWQSFGERFELPTPDAHQSAWACAAAAAPGVPQPLASPPNAGVDTAASSAVAPDDAHDQPPDQSAPPPADTRPSLPEASP